MCVCGCAEYKLPSEAAGQRQELEIPPHLVAAVGLASQSQRKISIGIKRKPRTNRLQTIERKRTSPILCVFDFCNLSFVCALLFVFVPCSGCRVSCSSVVQLTTLGEHGRQGKEASPTYGGHPGGKW